MPEGEYQSNWVSFPIPPPPGGGIMVAVSEERSLSGTHCPTYKASPFDGNQETRIPQPTSEDPSQTRDQGRCAPTGRRGALAGAIRSNPGRDRRLRRFPCCLAGFLR